jgi:hypothetical protein
MSLTQKVYLIWEEFPNNPELAKSGPTCFATTAFEARKECVRLAREKCPDQDPNERPLYHGEQPNREGKTLIYTFPGPNETSIDVYDVIKSRPWFGEPMLTLGKHEYRVCYKEIERARSVVKQTPPPPPSPESRYDAKKTARGNDTPHDQLLNAIENFARAPPAPPLPTKEWLNKVVKEATDATDAE